MIDGASPPGATRRIPAALRYDSTVSSTDAKLTLAADRRRLFAVLAVTSAYCVAEFACGVYTGSLALLSDAVHMLTDVAAICLSLVTLWISSRPARGGKTYGYLRAEILGALFNGLFLWLLVIFIWIEAVNRLRNPTPVAWA